MPSQVCLALLELNGVGFSVDECERQKHVMQAKLAALESQAYELAGHGFALTSTDDIAQVRWKLFFWGSTINPCSFGMNGIEFCHEKNAGN